MMYETATLRSGFSLTDNAKFASNVERMMRKMLGVSEDAQVDPEPEMEPEADAPKEEEEEVDADDEAHDEL